MQVSKRVAILYQAQPAPPRNGIVKPLKPGGYSDSGADIGFCLQQRKVSLVTPKINPEVNKDLDWVFPDTREGISQAIDSGANTLWLNTVLFSGHPIENFIENGAEVVGQIPKYVDMHDDKILTNMLLKENNLPIPKTIVLNSNNFKDVQADMAYPLVLKPIRGRGSQGVQVIGNRNELFEKCKDMLEKKIYGDTIYIEEYLPGREITLTIMPPGNYVINMQNEIKSGYWSLPAVKRFNHENGIAPYCGDVPVSLNSSVLTDEELSDKKIKILEDQCALAAELVHAKAPIRVDCRESDKGEYMLFDLNMKPNMTGPSRPHRQEQDSLTAIAAKAIGWQYPDLLINMLNQSWRKPAS